jgi:carbon-monoxide dehydrogenase large subunit
MLEVAPEDLGLADWRWSVAGRPVRRRLDPGARARPPAGSLELPRGSRPGLDAEAVYDPPNLTFPFGAYVCVVDIDPRHRGRQGPPLHRRRRLRRAHQPDDRRGPDPRRPDDGIGMALMETIAFDETATASPAR